MGANRYPRINSIEKDLYIVLLSTQALSPNTSAIWNKIPFNKAISATKTRIIAATLTAIFIPSLVPFVIEVNRFSPITLELTSTLLFISSVWGNIIFEITIAPGAAITDATIKFLATSILWIGSSPPKNPMKAAKTLPATVAIPPVIKTKYSDLFIFSKYPFTRSGASVCPKKMFPVTARLSWPEIFKSFVNIQAKTLTTLWIIL